MPYHLKKNIKNSDVDNPLIGIANREIEAHFNWIFISKWDITKINMVLP